MSLRIIEYSVLFILLGNACTGNIGNKEPDQTGRTGSYIKYAERFDITQNAAYSILTIKNPWQGAENINQSYILLPAESEIPDGIDPADVIRVPIKKIICMSTTHLSMISALNESNTIKGISGADYLYNKDLLERIKNKSIADVGYEDNLNKEMIIQIAPDLVMVYGIGSESSGYISKLKELGIRILFNADYLETDPLGKAEWVKVFGALYKKGKEADDIFYSVTKEYNNLKSYINENSKNKPTVFLGLPWKDTWYISPGNSYISRLISDAGGEYLWKDTKSEISMPVGLENVYFRAINADYWLNTGVVNHLREITAIDNRLEELPSFIKGNIFNNNNRITLRGGNDYWESGSINPQIILRDIASILHPDLFPGYKLFFIRK